ncbi:MAG: formylglycine-generating enzyme family protein [Nitrospirae bacterium]|nr:formylglycine-generating enzyme family protein [Nitrospirota bacterium]
MSKWLVGIYLLLILLIVVIIQVGIYHSNAPAPKEKTEKTSFKPMAVRLEETKAATQRMETVLTKVRVDPEYESMVLIPAGEFVMGNEGGHWMEKPERKVFLSGYTMDKYEVTFAQYFQFVKATGHRKPRLAGYLAVDAEAIPILMNPFSPVTGVTWEDARAYCRWKGKRLPTEAEWEKAARGTDGRDWPWGNEKDMNRANLLEGGDGYEYASPVGSLKADRSPFGIYDMAGNSMEWTSDWFQEDYYRVSPNRDPQGPETGQERVVRGASWHDALDRARASVRFKVRPEYRDVTIGFRCVRSG